MRWIRAIGALAALIALVVVPPLLLVTQVGNPVGAFLHGGLIATEDAVISLLALALWVFWGYLLIVIVAEAVAAARGARLAMPGTFGLQEHLIRPLIGTIFSVLVGVGTTAQANAATPVGPTHSATVASHVTSDSKTTEAAKTHPYTVREGDTLWDLAHHLLGDGAQWHQIAELNQGHTMNDGRTFDRLGALRPGWKILLPGPAPTAIKVDAGDTLSEIAQDYTGDANHWPTLAKINHIHNPDAIDIGQVIHLPTRDGSAGTSPSTAAARPTPRPAATATPAPVDTTPQDASSTPTAPATSTPTVNPPHHAEVAQSEESTWPKYTVGGVGLLLAAALVGLIAQRRRRQQQRRAPGERIALPDEQGRATEVELRTVAAEQTAGDFDKTLRSLDSVWPKSNRPAVQAARVVDGKVELYFPEAVEMPSPWTDVADGTAWSCALVADEPPAGAANPWPALVTLGHDDEDGLVMLNLDQVKALDVHGDDHAEHAITAMLLELATGSWSDDVIVTCCGQWAELEDLLDRDRVRYVPSLADWEPLTTDCTEVLFVPDAAEIDDELSDRADQAGVPMVTLSGTSSTWSLDIDDGHAVLQPLGLPVRPQLVDHAQYAGIVEVLTATQRPATSRREEPSHPTPPDEQIVDDVNEDSAADEAPLEPVDEPPAVSRAEAPADQPRATTASVVVLDRPTTLTPTDIAPTPTKHSADLLDTGHPVLRILTPVVDLIGAGDAPSSTSHRGVCLRIATYLALHRSANKTQLVHHVWGGARVSSGTVDPRISNLRKWLGTNPLTEQPYLANRTLQLDEVVRTDWDIFQETVGTPETATTAQLETALQLVDGPPFSGEDPQQFAFAEFDADDMIAAVVDVAYELGRRRYLDGRWREVEKWAAFAVRFEPGMERLWRLWIHAAHSAGNPPAVDQALARMHARISELGFDLEPETIELINALKAHDTATINDGREAL